MTTPTVPETPNRDWLVELGKTLLTTPLPEPVVVPTTPPVGFPGGIPVDTITFSDWSGYIDNEGVQIARIASADDVAAVCTWAAQHGYTVRAVGRGHNWSPIVMEPNAPRNTEVMLIDTAKLNATSFEIVDRAPLATFGTGITVNDATAYLQTLDNNGASSAPGYSLPHMPAPGGITLGGVLAIGGHGTLVPSGTGEPDVMGSLSNLITGFDAVVSGTDAADKAVYSVQHFERADTDAAAFLVHLGRAFLTAVTLNVVPNYYLQLHCLFPNASDLFASPAAGSTTGSEVSPAAPSAPTYANLLDEYGRVEVLWFPYNLQAFVQCNQRQSNAIAPQVTGPYNYPWMEINSLENAAIRAALFEWPSLTPVFGAFEFALAQTEQSGVVLNGTARDLELYLMDSTLKVTLWGWALQIPRAEVQTIASAFYQKVNSMLDADRGVGKYPINAALELRCTTIDKQDALPQPTSPPPTLSAAHSVNPQDATLDTVIWLNVGTITATPGSNEFYTELEQWVVATWGGQTPNRLRPEWSKAWAYTADGPWTNIELITSIRDSYNQSTDTPYTLEAAASTLARYDASNIFTNPLLQSVFSS